MKGLSFAANQSQLEEDLWIGAAGSQGAGEMLLR